MKIGKYSAMELYLPHIKGRINPSLGAWLPPSWRQNTLYLGEVQLHGPKKLTR